MNNHARHEILRTGYKSSSGRGVILNPDPQRSTYRWQHRLTVTHATEPNDMHLSTHVQVQDRRCFNLALLASGFAPRAVAIARFDSFGTAHDNGPDYPLNGRSVPTPHFHKYDQQGREVAYRAPLFSTESSTESADYQNLEAGIRCFCDEVNLVHEGAGAPPVHFPPPPVSSTQLALFPVPEPDPSDPNGYASFD